MNNDNENKKLVPELRFPEFLSYGEWESITIEKLVKDNILFPQKDGNHGNIHPKSSDFVKNGIPFIMASDIRNGQINYAKCKHISKQQADSLQKGFAKEEDVLLTHKGTIGEVAIIEKNDFPYLMLTPQVTYYRIKDKNKLYNKFLRFYFCSDEFQSKLSKLSGGGTRAYVGITAQGKLNISIPPRIKEQKKIANCLSSLDNLIQAQSEKLDSLKEHKKGMLQQLFPADGEKVPKLRFPEFLDDGEWEKKALGDIGKPLMCKRILKKETNPNSGVPFYKIGTFGKRADSFIPISLYEEYKQKYSFPNVGDILISASGTIGRLVVYDGKDAYYQDSNIVWLGHEEKEVSNHFLYYSYSILNWQTSDGGIIKRLYNNNLREMKICFPKNKKEQQKIANCLSSLDCVIEKQTKKIETLKEHKKGLMQQLFPNKI